MDKTFLKSISTKEMAEDDFLTIPKIFCGVDKKLEPDKDREEK